MSIKALFEGKLSEGKIKISENLKSGDYVVIHTSVSYEPDITIVSKSEVNDYFNEDTGWEESDANDVKKMSGSGEVLYLGQMDPREIIVIKV